MKEATGELNLTLFVIIAVGVLAAFFFTVLWPMMRSSQNRVANCNVAICKTKPNIDNTVTCYREKDPDKIEFKCPWKG